MDMGRYMCFSQTRDRGFVYANIDSVDIDEMCSCEGDQ